jgi:flavodoxin
MKTLVVYDSQFGNTETIARAIAAGIGGEVTLARVADADAVSDLDLLICGSPTQGGRPTTAVQQFLKRLPALDRTHVAAFDTRVAAAEQGLPLRLLMGAIGFAAPRIEKALLRRGGRVAAPAAGFIVNGKEGPLLDGEFQRAEAWGRSVGAAAAAAASVIAAT